MLPSKRFASPPHLTSAQSRPPHSRKLHPSNSRPGPLIAALHRPPLPHHQAVLGSCRACVRPVAYAHEIEAGEARLVQVTKWQKLSAALVPSAAGEWDLAALREALEEAKAAGLQNHVRLRLASAEAEMILQRAEKAAKERTAQQQMKLKREAEKNLNAAMPSVSGMGKTDAAWLGKAIDMAKEAGVEKQLVGGTPDASSYPLVLLPCPATVTTPLSYSRAASCSPVVPLCPAFSSYCLVLFLALLLLLLLAQAFTRTSL